MYVPAHNPTDSPIVVDDDGHLLEGGGWGAVDADADQVAVHVDAGRLNIFEAGFPSETPVTAEARHAQQAADRLNKAAKAGKSEQATIRADQAGAGKNGPDTV